jgi:hypothetical protein
MLIKRKRVIKENLNQPVVEAQADEEDNSFVSENDTDFVSDATLKVQEELREEFDSVMNQASSDAVAKLIAITSQL